MKKSAVYIIQARLKELGHYTGAIDGERGPLTHAAVLKALQARAGDLPTAWQEWSDKRQAIA
ncbi:MAG: peptidoglycan-binding protein, partial [Candidatus Competibacteraceae bacterium]|nr:peptidoglycan-binding protein [Candidatus Competibacteraceae bacterium]